VTEVPLEPAYRSLVRTLGLLRRAMEPYFARHGISPSQWWVLRALSLAEEEDGENGIRLTDLSDRLLVRPPSVTGAIDRLERSGLVVRTASPTDQRAKRVKLTPLGWQLVERVRAGHATRVQRVLGAFSRDEQRELRRLLDRLGDQLEELTENDPRKRNHDSH
jgi:DNA-binding MarR family transcriptional regulator